MNKQQLMEEIKNLPIKKQKDIINQTLETAIKMYQNTQSQKDFDLIVDLYNPYKYIHYWKNKYGHLCDNNYEDFESEYMLCFVKACKFYKKEAKNYNSFNNYFFSIISNHFKNIMSQMSCNKRNPSLICPLCNKEVAPLNIHILRNHHEFIQEFINKHSTQDNQCPFCQYSSNNLYDHIISKHSSLIYEYFQENFPEYNTSIQNPAPPIGLIYINNDNINSIEDLNIKPLYFNDNTTNIISINNFSECQKTIRDIFKFYNISKLPSYKKLCEMCKEMRGDCSCPKGNEFKFTKYIYENEIKDLYNKIKDDI